MRNGIGKILIVDDDTRNIFALMAVLRSRKYDCLSASDMPEAISLLSLNREIGVILLDMMLPEMDGYEGISKIREIPGYETIPIVAVTAQAMMGDRERCLQAGANWYISKPVNVDELMDLLNTYS